jgi:hypothetical protein
MKELSSLRALFLAPAGAGRASRGDLDHQLWAQRASLVVELDREAGALPDAMLEEIRRFRLGLYTMRRRDDDSFEMREEIGPARTDDAQPEDVNSLIDTFLGRDLELRNEYRRWIGR